MNGVAYLDDKLYIACEKSKSLIVFLVVAGAADIAEEEATLTFTRQTPLTIKDLERPLDMAACRTNRCLYVADFGGVVLRVYPASGRVERWLDGAKGEASFSGLSVTGDGRVLATMSKDGRVQIYSATDARLMTEVLLPRRTSTKPQHAVATPTGNIVVSAIVNAADASGEPVELHVVGDVSPTGAPTAADYGGPRGGGPDRLYCPRHVAVDDAAGRGAEQIVYVADSNNHRIVALDVRRLNRVAIVDCVDTTDQPWRLCVGRVAGLAFLVVGMVKGGVDVYQMNYFS